MYKLVDIRIPTNDQGCPEIKIQVPDQMVAELGVAEAKRREIALTQQNIKEVQQLGVDEVAQRFEESLKIMALVTDIGNAIKVANNNIIATWSGERELASGLKL